MICPFVHEKVYYVMCVTDTPFHIQVDNVSIYLIEMRMMRCCLCLSLPSAAEAGPEQTLAAPERDSNISRKALYKHK